MVSLTCGIQKTMQRIRGEGRGKSSERKTKHERLLTTGSKLRAAGGELGEGWGTWVMGMNEGM